jgi:4-hydroxyacetophenone monooxygenase
VLTEGESYPVDVIVYATGTNLAHGGSLIFHSECQMRYIMGCLKVLIEGGHAAMECKQSVQDEYDERLQDALSRMVWSHPSIASSWFKNEAGRLRVLSPWRLVDYWNWTQSPDLSDFDLS